MTIETSMSSPTPAPLSGRGQTLRKIRSQFSEAVLNRSLTPNDFLQRYSAAIDDWLGAIFDAATRQRPRGCALVAVGGYGRGELYPGSDLDLVLVHHTRRDYQRVAHEIWYEIWDGGIRL